MSTGRKPTNAELHAIEADGTLAPNAVFDGVNYIVTPQAKPASGTTKKTTARKSSPSTSEASIPDATTADVAGTTESDAGPE